MRNSNGASTLDVPATGDVQAAARRRPLRSAQTSTQIAVTLAITPKYNVYDGTITWTCCGTPTKELPSTCR